MNLFVRALVAGLGATAIWIGGAIIIAGVRAALEGTPERITSVATPLLSLPL